MAKKTKMKGRKQEKKKKSLIDKDEVFLDTNIEENIQLNQNEKLDNKINITKEIKEEENAEIVKKELVEEHEDIHQISNRNLNEDEIFISNLPFNASKEDIRKIFSKYGRIKK